LIFWLLLSTIIKIYVSAPKGTTVTLSDLQRGQRATVKTINATGALKSRLLSLGIRPDAVLTLEESGPFKSTLKLQTANGSVAIRQSEAALVAIEVAA
jgi:ferrous iron transport protein A